MKHLAFFFVTFASAVSAMALPAVGLKCESTDRDFSLEAIINHYTGDYYDGSLKVTIQGVQKPAAIKQYSYYENDLLMILSLGPEGPNDDSGYVLDLRRNYNDETRLYGNAKKYTANPQSARQVDDSSRLSIDCSEIQ